MAPRLSLTAALICIGLAQSLGAATVEEAVPLRFDLTLGHAWTERLRIRDHELVEDLQVDEPQTEKELRLTLDYRVLPPEHVIPPMREELTRVEVTVREAESYPVVHGEPLAHFDLGEANPMASTVGISIVDRVDSQGYVVPSED
ncbi:hypothetical protein JXA47_06415 [Candidatus Sumerlaeota bacterium]|nr:hypothetical protein [Candidatus Sumerlaeota bacterium]